MSETSETSIEPATNRSLSVTLQHVPSAEVQSMMLTKKGIAPLPGKPYHWLLDQQGGYPSSKSIFMQHSVKKLGKCSKTAIQIY